MQSSPPPPPIKRLYYTVDNIEVLGPVLSDSLFAKVLAKELPDVSVCEEGTNEWKLFSTLPDSAFSPVMLARYAAIKTDQQKPIDDANKAMANGCGVIIFLIVIILGTLAWKLLFS